MVLIYEEKNTFLTRGRRIDEKGIRGADGRMGYVDDMDHDEGDVTVERNPTPPTQLINLYSTNRIF